MATEAEQDRRKRAFIFILIGALALLLIAAALAGTLSFNWDAGMANSNLNASVGLDSADESDGADVGGVTDESNGCFLGFICVNANANLDGPSLNASADDEGVDADADND